MIDQLDQVQVPAPLHTDLSLAVCSYAIGPIHPTHLVTLHVRCSNGEECPLLVPKTVPFWILTHPEFRDGYEQNYFSEVDEDDKEWKGTIPHMVHLIYSKLCGEGFANLASGKVDPDFGAWEIGYLLRDFTRLADTDQERALTGIAHLCFLVSFLPSKPPECWPPAGLVQARWPHTDAVNAYRERVRSYREQGKSYQEAQWLALAGTISPISEVSRYFASFRAFSSPERAKRARQSKAGRTRYLRNLIHFLRDPAPSGRDSPASTRSRLRDAGHAQSGARLPTDG